MTTAKSSIWQVSPPAPLEVLLPSYQQYLEGERGLSESTIKHYLRCARVFLGRACGAGRRGLARVVGRAGHQLRPGVGRARRGAGRVTLLALRSLLRYLHVAGHVPLALAWAGPAGGPALETGPAARGVG